MAIKPFVFTLMIGVGLPACEFSNPFAQDKKEDCADNPDVAPHLVWSDADNDGFVGTQNTILACELSDMEIDCDDDNGHVHPAANEYCDGIDNDCDGLIDDADPSLIDGPWPEVRLTTVYLDGDGDGYGDPTTAIDCCHCDEWSNYVENNWDCDDSNALLKAITEDADCDGVLTVDDCDDSNPTTPNDMDDGTNDMDCDGVLTADDCDDADPALLAQANDTDCDGFLVQVDCDDNDSSIGVFRFYQDVDGDGHGDPNAYSDGCLQIWGTSLSASDCDDTNPNVYLDAPEICDGIDNDCDTAIDDADADRIGANVLVYVDDDEDGFGHSTATTYACAVHPGVSANNLDCDDQDAYLGDCVSMPDSIRLTGGHWTREYSWGSSVTNSCHLSASVYGWVVGAGKHCPFSFDVSYDCDNGPAIFFRLSQVTEDISCGYQLVDIIPQTLSGSTTSTFHDNGMAYMWFRGPYYTSYYEYYANPHFTDIENSDWYEIMRHETCDPYPCDDMNPSDLVPLDPSDSFFESFETVCNDGLDNDQDDLTDCCDTHCAGTLTCAAEASCDDGFDNDCDQLTDCLDLDCNGLSGCEHSEELSCSDGFDNDSDQRTDCLDVDCDGQSGCEYQVENSCFDGHDNDGDGLTDCHDSDCLLSHPSDCLDTDGDGVFFFEDCDDSDASVGSHFDIDADEPFDSSNPLWLGDIWTMTQTSVSSDFWFTRSEDKEDAFAFSFFPFYDGSVYNDGLTCEVDLSAVSTLELQHEGMPVTPSNINGSALNWSTLTPGDYQIIITPNQPSCFANDIICYADNN